MPIRAITFDFWRTLFRHTHSDERRRNRIRVFCEATGATQEEADQAMALAESEFTRIHLGKHRTLGALDAVQIMTESLGISIPPEVLDGLAQEFARMILNPLPPVIEGAVEAVQKAAQRFPIGLISDTGFSPGAYLRELLNNHGLLDSFGVLVFSDEVGVSKPQPLLYEIAARELGVDRPELLHIGDLEATDILGAKRFGAKAGLFAGDNDRHLNDSSADYVFRSWREFVGWLPPLP